MNIPSSDRQTLRELARRVAEVAALPIQSRRAEQWRRLNTLQPERPMVHILPPEDRAWEELLPEASLICREPKLREWEINLRRRIFRHARIGDDWVITNGLDVPRVLHTTDLGLDINVVRPAEPGGAYTWTPTLRTARDLDKLRFQTLTFDREATQRDYQLAGDLFGDLLDVRIRGGANIGTWFIGRLSFMHGLEALLTDLYDNPALIHRAMTFQRDNMNHVLDQYEALGVLSLNTLPEDTFLMGSSAHTAELPAADYAGSVRLKDMWAYGECQEFVSVGPAQFCEFSLEYEAPVLRRFGLVAYGCCEPLDQKFDLILKQIPNLRLVSVSPWCDREIAAAKLGSRYVYAWKPNPALLCGPRVDWDANASLIHDTLRMARGCCVAMVMKDLHTIHGDASRLTRWAQLAMQLALEAV